MLIFDGKPLLGRKSYNILLPNARINPAGMGESILTTVYDDLLRATGTAQAAFHLVNMASVMLIMMQDYGALSSAKEGNKKLAKMNEICNSINIYKGAILDGLQVDVKSLPASFGSVPELVIAFIQFLSAAWDIPATRFIGQSPSGLNATGDSDLENYYNMVQSFRERRVTPRIKQILELLAIQEYGIKQGTMIADEMTIEFRNLWNDNPKEEAETAKMWLDGMMPLLDRGSISAEDFTLEAKKRNIILLADTNIKMGEKEDEFSNKVKDIFEKGKTDDSSKEQAKAD
jgi:phage-related protein (TIGR01555 family)